MTDTETMTAEQQFQAAREDMEGRLQNGLAELGYPANAGPEDADAVDKALLLVSGLQRDRDQLAAKLEKAEKANKRAEAKVTKGDAPAKPRKLGMPKDPVDVDRDALKEALVEADKVEIAFSDGKMEIAGLDPVNVSGDAWRDHQRGYMLSEPVTMAGPSGGSSVVVAGYALLIDGKQVAYTERSDPLTIAPGQRIELRDDIYF